jgi:hypothetical protein
LPSANSASPEAALLGPTHQHLEPRVERGIGEVGQRRGRLRRGPLPGDFSGCREQRHPLLGEPHGAADLGFIRRRACRRPDVAQHPGERLVRVAAGREPRPMPSMQLRKVRRGSD